MEKEIYLVNNDFVALDVDVDRPTSFRKDGKYYEWVCNLEDDGYFYTLNWDDAEGNFVYSADDKELITLGGYVPIMEALKVFRAQDEDSMVGLSVLKWFLDKDGNINGFHSVQITCDEDSEVIEIFKEKK